MEFRSPRILEVLRDTIEQAERTPGLGPNDPGVIQLKQILAQWTAERNAGAGDVDLAGQSANGSDTSHGKR